MAKLAIKAAIIGRYTLQQLASVKKLQFVLAFFAQTGKFKVARGNAFLANFTRT
jgi:hypothetical protein